MYKQPKIILIRGLPGSGKTTMAKQMVSHSHFEADKFLQVDGFYFYDLKRVSASHELCLAAARNALMKGQDVVVSNTFVRLWELQRYINLGYPFEIIECVGQWQNVHGVPQDKIDAMKLKWESILIEMKSNQHADFQSQVATH
ncbi:AAA family ATPase [Massilia psychrophila]|uniref:AAA family ATPase n=1 Tax=Massilia psychrophila TaxID=1603353 RepID=A0A2G8SZP4_9BURK|nr:AAA family ATPase [Massilia psychrophila]PIL39192.1 hypothetical protein CR103_13975 [Massilia psychrophila]GGE82190.1 shikimate kinase [Massilia psychrophila]